jgi:hypothetical protein
MAVPSNMQSRHMCKHMRHTAVPHAPHFGINTVLSKGALILFVRHVAQTFVPPHSQVQEPPPLTSVVKHHEHFDLSAMMRIVYSGFYSTFES